MIKKIILTAIIAATITSCKKNVIKGDFLTSSTYKASGTATILDTKLYTSSGIVITDTTQIRSFVQRNTFPAHDFTFGSSSVSFPSNYITIHFKINNTAQVDRFQIGASPASSSVVSYPAAYYFIGTDRVDIQEIDSVTNYNYLNSCAAIFNKSLLVSVKKSCSPGTGTFEICRFLQRYPIRIINGKLFLEMISLVTKSGSALSYCTMNTTGPVWNFFDQGVTSTLSPGDTIAVQVKEMELVKQ
ncbi:MAG: hypothetical protein NTW29_14380 [Bacteroidetes bacterium]|nr:hypothetical protein [Bacteroidota bacterium]